MRYVFGRYIGLLFLLAACSRKPAEVDTQIQFDFQAFSSKKSGQSVSIGDPGEYCYFVHVQGPGVGPLYEARDEPDCGEDRVPQGIGILSRSVERSAAVPNPTIEIKVPEGSPRIFHLLRVEKDDLATVAGITGVSCLGGFRFGNAVDDQAQIFFDPDGAQAEVDVSDFEMEVIGYASASVKAGTVSTISMQPVYNPDMLAMSIYELGAEYGGCGGDDGDSYLSDGSFRVTMRPQMTGTHPGWAPVNKTRALRIDMAPPSWNQGMPASPAADVPADFIGYIVEVADLAASESTAPYCEGNAGASFRTIISGRDGISGAAVLGNVQRTTGLVADGDYEIRVCAQYSGGRASYGNVMDVTMLRDCTVYADSGTSLLGHAGAAAPKTICLDPAGNYTTHTTYSIADDDIDIYGYPNLDTMPSPFSTSVGPSADGLRGMPFINVNGTDQILFNPAASTKFTLANLDIKIVDGGSTSAWYALSVVDQNAQLEYMQNVNFEAWYGTSSVSGEAIALRTLQTGTIDEIRQSRIYIMSSDSNVDTIALKFLTTSGSAYQVNSVIANSILELHSSSSSSSVIATGDYARMGDLKSSEIMASSYSPGDTSSPIGLYLMSQMSKISSSNIQSSDNIALKMYDIGTGGVTLSQIEYSSFYSGGSGSLSGSIMPIAAIWLQGSSAPGTSPKIIDIDESKIMTSGFYANGIHLSGAADIDDIQGTAFIRRGANSGVEVGYSVAISGEAISSVLPTVGVSMGNRMCSEQGGAAQARWWQVIDGTSDASVGILTSSGYVAFSPLLFDYSKLLQFGNSVSNTSPEECDWSIW